MLASPDKVIGVVLLCALSLNAVYVAKWAFMCPSCGLKRARLGLFWGCFGDHFRCFRGPQVPMCVDSAWECPGMSRSGNFAEHDVNSAHLAPFCLIYVGLSGIKWLFAGRAFMCFYVGHLIETSQLL